MENIKLIESFLEFKDLKNIDKATMMHVIEDVFKNILIKHYTTDENFDIILNVDKGDFEIWRNRKVVSNDEIQNVNTEIKLSEAKKIDEDYEVGEEVTDEIKLADFGRRTILLLKQTLASKILELEKGNVYDDYKNNIGQLVTGEVYQIWKKEILVIDDEGNELILPKTEQIPSEYFRKGDTLRAVIYSVELKNGRALITISRTAPIFLEKLFETEVPEIFDGLITIKKVVRIPGERAKIAVESYDDRIDPVGACIGVKGIRIQEIVKELRNENIDVINYTSNAEVFVTRSLSPAKITSINIHEEKKTVEVFLTSDQVSISIGKNGQNIKLASEITGYKISAYRNLEENEEDVDLIEFSDEIEEWVIEELKSIGCDTAKSVLKLNVEDLIKRTDLEEETIIDVIRVLKSEFED